MLAIASLHLIHLLAEKPDLLGVLDDEVAGRLKLSSTRMTPALVIRRNDCGRLRAPEFAPDLVPQYERGPVACPQQERQRVQDPFPRMPSVARKQEGAQAEDS